MFSRPVAISVCRIIRFVNARMRLWRKYIVEERERVKETGKEEQENEAQEDEEESDDNKAVKKRPTREERMKRRAVKRQVDELETTANVEGEFESPPQKKRSTNDHMQSKIAQSTVVSAPTTATQLPSPVVYPRRSVVSFAPSLTSTTQLMSAFRAAFSASSTTSPARLPRILTSSAATVSAVASWLTPTLSPRPSAFHLSSMPLYSLSSDPPAVAPTSGNYRAAMFNFDPPATFTMSMTLPNTMQLPAMTDTVDTDATLRTEPMVEEACGAQLQARGGVTGWGALSLPSSTQLLSRSLRLTFTATQWASLAQLEPVTP